ncbi:MAG: 30S ribosomal protein S9 [Mangrovibacterium sp.]
MSVINTIGRRKEDVARIYMSAGSGKVTINKRDLNEYFTTGILQYIVLQPLNLLGVAGQYDIKVNLDGGGIKGQAEALRLAIARALVEIDADNKSPLRQAGFMTRDPREVERKKPGRPKARKRFQFSKR